MYDKSKQYFSNISYWLIKMKQMDIGVVIKKYRKEAGMTQEEMANRLGVTTPAVNKWENSNSKPDIELLAPIARLLDISLDTLLSFHENLSDTEIEEIIRKMDRMFSEEGYEKTYEWALRLIKEYPNCNMLIWQAAVMLDARRITDKCMNPEKYDKQINAWYELALHDENEEIQHHAADSLFGFYLRKKNYAKAEKYLDYFSEHDPMKSYYQGRLLQKQGKIKEAYEKYENEEDLNFGKQKNYPSRRKSTFQAARTAKHTTYVCNVRRNNSCSDYHRT